MEYVNQTARVSEKYQVVIPKSIRQRLGLQRGDELSLSLQGETILMRVRPRSFSEYTLGLHKEIWKETDATEYVQRERSSWKTPQQA